MGNKLPLQLSVCIIFLICWMDTSAQDAIANHGHYAIVYIDVPDKSVPWDRDPPHHCTVQYSDGTKEDLCKVLKLCDNDHPVNFNHELDVLEYLYKQNYELINTTGGTVPHRYYFKHK